MAPGFASSAANSGGGAVAVATRLCCARGCNLASASALISRGGRAGATGACSCTIFGCNSRCKFWRGRIDQRLPRMVRMHRVGHDALPRMKCFGALRNDRLGNIACYDLWLRGTDVQKGEILDRSRPGELRVVKSGVMTQCCAKQRERRNDEKDVPQRGRHHRPFRSAPLDPAIAKIIATQKLADAEWSCEERPNAAKKALVKVAPGDSEFGLDPNRWPVGRRRGRRRPNGRHPRCGGCALSQEI
jgi:hypothetical protein